MRKLFLVLLFFLPYVCLGQIVVATQSSLTSAIASYKTVLQATGSHTAAKVAGTYALGEGDPLAVSGTGTLYPLAVIQIVAADYSTINGLSPKLQLRNN